MLTRLFFAPNPMYSKQVHLKEGHLVCQETGLPVPLIMALSLPSAALVFLLQFSIHEAVLLPSACRLICSAPDARAQVGASG